MFRQEHLVPPTVKWQAPLHWAHLIIPCPQGKGGHPCQEALEPPPGVLVAVQVELLLGVLGQPAHRETQLDT